MTLEQGSIKEKFLFSFFLLPSMFPWGRTKPFERLFFLSSFLILETCSLFCDYFRRIVFTRIKIIKMILSHIAFCVDFSKSLRPRAISGKRRSFIEKIQVFGKCIVM